MMLNLLATGLILLGGVMAAQLVLWLWSGTATPPRPTLPWSDLGIGANWTRHSEIQFGDAAGILQRTPVHGDVTAARAVLRDAARKALRDPLPDRPTGPAEREWLRQLRLETAVETDGSGGHLFELDAPLPMTVAVSVRPAAGETVPSPGRVVSWGLALPVDREPNRPGETWLAITYRLAAGTPLAADGSDDPLPGGARRGMVLHTETSARLMTFHGTGTKAEWMAYYDDWSRRSGWRPATPWRDQGRAAFRRYLGPQNERREVHLAQDGEGQMRGLVYAGSDEPETSPAALPADPSGEPRP